LDTYLIWEGDRPKNKDTIITIDFLTEGLTGERLTAKWYGTLRDWPTTGTPKPSADGFMWDVTSQLDTCKVEAILPARNPPC